MMKGYDDETIRRSYGWFQCRLFGPTPSATHKGILPLGGLQLECYVLDDGRRVFNKRGMAEAIGLKPQGGNAFIRAMEAQSLGSELDENLLESINNPIYFNPLTGDLNLGHGYEAEVLVEVCKAVIRANIAGRLKPQQMNMARQAHKVRRSNLRRSCQFGHDTLLLGRKPLHRAREKLQHLQNTAECMDFPHAPQELCPLDQCIHQRKIQA